MAISRFISQLTCVIAERGYRGSEGKTSVRVSPLAVLHASDECDDP